MAIALWPGAGVYRGWCYRPVLVDGPHGGVMWRLGVVVAVVLLLVLAVPVHAQLDPCDACMADWSPAECPCLPLAPEPWGAVYLPAILRGP